MTRTVTLPATFAGIDTWQAVGPPTYNLDTSRVTIVGGGAANMFADGNDATYAVLPPDYDADTMTGVGPLVTFPAVTIPATAHYPGDPTRPGIGYAFNIRGRQETGSWFSDSLIDDVQPGNNNSGYDSGYYSRGSIGNYPATLTTTWRTWTAYDNGDLWWSNDAPTEPGPGGSDGAYPRTDAFREGLVAFVLMNRAVYVNAPIWVSEVTLTLAWDGGGEVFGTPPLRQLQRGDGHGLGGVPRAVQHNTQQASFRTLRAPY